MNDRPLVIGKGTKQRRDKYTWRYRHSLGKDPVTGKLLMFTKKWSE